MNNYVQRSLVLKNVFLLMQLRICIYSIFSSELIYDDHVILLSQLRVQLRANICELFLKYSVYLLNISN